MNQHEVDAKDLAAFDEVCFGDEGMSAEEWLQVLDEKSVVFRHERNGNTVAIGVAKWDAGIGYLYSVATLPEFRKQGIAAKLTANRLEFLRGAGCVRVQAHTRIGNEASQAGLRKAGFVAIQYVTDFYGDFEDGILWEKMLG